MMGKELLVGHIQDLKKKKARSDIHCASFKIIVTQLH